MYLLPNISKTKKILRLSLSKRFFILTLILYLTYFGWKMEFLSFNIVFFLTKHKRNIIILIIQIKFNNSCQKMSSENQRSRSIVTFVNNSRVQVSFRLDTIMLVYIFTKFQPSFLKINILFQEATWLIIFSL